MQESLELQKRCISTVYWHLVKTARQNIVDAGPGLITQDYLKCYQIERPDYLKLLEAELNKA